MKLENLSTSRISDTVVTELERLIALGEFQPGDKLPPERVLSQRFAVSRTALREALSQLEARGVIVSHRGAGTWINEDLTPQVSGTLLHLVRACPQTILDVLELRRALEELAAERAALNGQPREIERLSQCFHTLITASQRGDLAAETEADMAFHLAIAHASKNSPLTHVIHSLFGVIRTNIGENLQRLHSVAEHRSLLEKQHRRIFDAIRHRHPKAARQAAHDHLAFVIASFAREFDQSDFKP